MSITIDDLKTIYADNLILQYRTKARARATAQALTQEIWLDGLMLVEQTCFDLDTAVGAQLDVLGRIVGVNRNVYGLDLTHTFWDATSYTGTPAGVNMQRYADATYGPEIMLRYRSDAVYTLSDFEMRTLVKLKIIFNTAAMTTKAIIEAMYALFGTSVQVVDNKNMTMTLNVSDPYHNVFTVAAYLGIIPKPAGVAATVNNI